ncbi:MAG: galactose oxidase early set domain-containing protein [Polyangiaceae bacterium]|nr:galactose oxidase early set domain-containing protein [Polyangiaceae bacterium]
MIPHSRAISWALGAATLGIVACSTKKDVNIATPEPTATSTVAPPTGGSGPSVTTKVFSAQRTKPAVLSIPKGVWSPLVQLRDKTDTWTVGRPADGWVVTPIHATLMPDTGKVLITGWSRAGVEECKQGEKRHNGTSWVLDPEVLRVSEPFTLNVQPLDEKSEPPSDVLYCAGHVPLADGRIFHAGGSRYEKLGMPGEIERGINYARIFKPSVGAFERVPDPMTGGPAMAPGARWYPSATKMPDGSVVVIGGFTQYADTGHLTNLSIERFSPALYDAGMNPWKVLVSHDESTPDLAADALDYNRAHLLYEPVPADKAGGHPRTLATVGGIGAVLLVNTDDGVPGAERIFHPANGQRRTADNLPLQAGLSTGTLVSTGEIMIMGGTNADETRPRLDLYDPYKDSWRTIDTKRGRRQPSSVLLPDGTVLLIHGVGEEATISERLVPQIFDPVAGTVTDDVRWPEATDRGVHSFGLLLKDGTILMGGGVATAPMFQIGCEHADLRIYTPPYLRIPGKRPALSNVTEPLTLSVGGANVTLNYDGSPLKADGGAVLMAAGSITHSIDQNARYVKLNYSVNGTKLTLTPPDTHLRAPPGDYLLFLIGASGIPSVGVHVRLP